MKNINSSRDLEGKKNFVYNTHYKMPKIKFNNKRRRRVPYQGIVNQDPVKIVLPVLPFKNL